VTTTDARHAVLVGPAPRPAGCSVAPTTPFFLEQACKVANTPANSSNEPHLFKIVPIFAAGRIASTRHVAAALRLAHLMMSNKI